MKFRESELSNMFFCCLWLLASLVQNSEFGSFFVKICRGSGFVFLAVSFKLKSHMGVSLNNGTPQTSQNDHF